MSGPRKLALVLAIAIGVVAVPVVFWLIVPSIPSRIESPDGFHWVGTDAKTGQPLLLRAQSDGHLIVAGSERTSIPRDEPVRCHDADPAALDALREAAKARGRIDDLALTAGRFHRLTVRSDDLGGGKTTYLYRCGGGAAHPLLSWTWYPTFGAQSIAIGWVAWGAIAFGLIGVARRR